MRDDGGGGDSAKIFAMTIMTMTFALLGFLSPANRGGLLTCLLLLFVFCGSFGGSVVVGGGGALSARRAVRSGRRRP